MKRFLLIATSFLISSSLFAQVQTTISGRIANNQDGSLISLTTNTFSLQTMVDDIRGLISADGKDSSFLITTGKIIKPNTICWLVINNELLKLALSPGDSIHIETDYWSLLNSVGFSGKGSGKNRYLKEYNLRFTETNRLDNIKSRDYHFAENIKAYRLDEESVLNSWLCSGQIDTAFYEMESARIRFEYYDNLLHLDGNRPFRNGELISAIRAEMEQIDLSDTAALVNFPEYRSLITKYIRFLADSTGRGGGLGLQGSLRLAEEHLTGPVRNYYVFDQIRSAYINAGIDQKPAILEFATSSYQDPELVRLITGLEHGKKGGLGSSFYTHVVRSFLFIIIMALIASLLVLSALSYSRQLQRKNRRLNTAAGWLILLMFFLVWLAVLSPFPGRTVVIHLKLASMFVILAFLGVHAFLLIPKFIIKKRYGLYAPALLLLIFIYSFANYLIARSNYNSNWIYTTFNHIKWVQFSLVSVLVLVLVSFIVFHLFHLAKHNKPVSGLLKSESVSLEVFVNVLVVAFLFAASVAGSTQISGLRTALLLILALFVLYYHAFNLIPRYLFKRDYLKYLAYSAGLFILTGLVLAINDTMMSFFGLISRGVPADLFSLIRFPQNLEIYLAVIPGLIYAYSRKRLIERTNQGYALFRNKEAELNQLRSQVNPHFLFNSLNTVYAFALKENNPKTAEYIAKLANLMRYLVDDMEKERIPVQKEISYINDYINLQSIRSSVEHRIEITDLIGEDQNILIAPMLMIPFVENAFKHGINPNVVSELKVTFQVRDGQFQFVIENSVDKGFEAFYKEKGFGIGIPNVRQRLEYIYPGRHTLSIADTGDRFIVILTVDLEPIEPVAR